MSDPIADLVSLLARLPGIGERTASRLVFHVLSREPEYAAALGAALSSLHEQVHACERCGNFSGEVVCDICRDPRRSGEQLCVVARVPDLIALERSGGFRGRYHVLHKLLAPLEGIGPSDLPLDRLRERIAADKVREVIVATPLSVEGEATALYVASVLQGSGVAVSRIASGLPHGGELEFTDQITLTRALEGRRGL